MSITQERTPAHIVRRPLFRPESLHARQMVWLGRHTLALGPPAALSSISAVLLTVAAIALLSFGTYARRVELHGVVLPTAGLIPVSSPAVGRVQSLRVQEGQAVTSGTPLYTVNTDITTGNGDTAQKVLQALAAQRAVLLSQIARKTKLLTQQDAELEQQSKNLQAQIEQVNLQTTMKEEFVQKLTKDYGDYSRFVQTGIGTMNERRSVVQSWMRAKDELEELRTKALQLQGRLIEVQSQQANNHLRADNEIDEVRAKISDLDRLVADTEGRRSFEIRATEAGTVTAITSYAGQMVASGARMLTIVPSQKTVQVELLAPSNSIGFVRTGQRVLLRYSAFPYQKFGQYWGTVTEVSHAALQPEELKSLVPSLPASDQSKTFYRVIVAPERQGVTAYGRVEALEASMQVDAHVLLESRPIYQWILEPIYGLHGG